MATHSNIASIILAQVCGLYAHFSKQHGGSEGQVPELFCFSCDTFLTSSWTLVFLFVLPLPVVVCLLVCAGSALWSFVS